MNCPDKGIFHPTEVHPAEVRPAKGRRRKVGIMGGTFNPIHIGHLLLAENAYSVFGLDEVLFLPSGCSYMKEQSCILPAGIRLEMTRLAVADNPHFRVSPLETDRTGYSYTCETLAQLCREHPDTDYFFLVGADSLFAIETWKDPELIFRYAEILAAVRDDCDPVRLEAQAEHLRRIYGARIRLIPSGSMEISSSEIRKRLEDGRSVRYLVPAPVLRFIREKGLYRQERDAKSTPEKTMLSSCTGFTSRKLSELRRDMEKALERKRYEHTLGVSYTAAALAMRYGYDISRAEAAGLLHDCAKNLTHEKQQHICQKHHIPLTPAERKNPHLLHAKAGRCLAREKYGITDGELLDSIAWHTTGRPEMTLLDKIIYIADYIEPGRFQAPGLDEVRRLAFQDLDACLVRILEDTLNYLASSHIEIDPMTQQTYDYYSDKNGGI